MKDKIMGYLKKLFKILKKPEMAILPANIAFYIILAIIPLLTVVVFLASTFDISIDMVTNLIDNIMPNQVSEVINEVISGKGIDKKIGLFNILAFILASNGTYAIITTSDILYKIKNPDLLRKRISSFVLLLIIIILFVFLMIVPLFGENILNLISSAKIFENYIEDIIKIFNLIKWPLTILIIYLNIKLIYTVAPSNKIKSEETTYGAIFTTFVWLIATLIFRFYLEYFAKYDILYGSLSSIIIMMVWVYFLSYIFVFGMAINVSRKEEQQLLEEQLKIEEEKKNKKRKKGKQ
ncbi:MAG: YihY/virulence factor BrkB family protein [Bacilli bacterium]|nr:YihY/virulence factor BrkB family protein [Bacilli bacterium]